MTPLVLDLFFMEETMRGRMLPFVQPTLPQIAYLEALYPDDFAKPVRCTPRGFGDKRRLIKETDFDSMEYLAFEQAWMAEQAKRKGK